MTTYKTELVLFLSLITASCTGPLSSEQRAQIHHRMASHEIKQIKESELTARALVLGDDIVSRLQTAHVQHQLDSIATAGIDIFLVRHPSHPLRKVERKIMEAYRSVISSAPLEHNIQREGMDTLFYTKPIVVESNVVIVAIRFTRKQVIQATTPTNN